MRNRTRSMSETIHEPGLFLAAGRHEWEHELGDWTGPLLYRTDNWLIAADATLYYLRDLRRRLDAVGRLPHEPESGALVAAALDQWGARFARYVEGDYAFIVLDRRQHKVLLVRDTAGQRRLAWTQLADGTLVVATTPNAVAAYPGVSNDYELATLVAAASGFMGRGDRTTFSAVRNVGTGKTLLFEPGSGLHVADEWVPPAFSDDWEDTPSDADSDRLRSLIEDATCERLPAQGIGTVWMSGGSDSTAIFGAGNAGLRARRDNGREIRPVSMSFPSDDPACEDDVIRDVAAKWNAPVHWIPLDSIPIIAEQERRVALRDDAMVHTSESMLRTLMKGTREVGSRVALEGNGGDFLFHVSDSVVADHLFHGRWSELLEWWRQRRQWGFRRFARQCVLPLMTESTLSWIGLLRGRPIAGYWDLPVPFWMRPLNIVAEESRPHITRLPSESPSAFENRRLLTQPHVPQVLSWNHGFGLDEGVQVRTPLLDRRVVEFAATRPASERNSGRGSKMLLRRAMRDLLPDSAVLQRTIKRGVLTGYFQRQFDFLRAEVGRFFGAGAARLELAKLGVVDQVALNAAVSRYMSGHAHVLGGMLLQTMEAERWLQWRAERR